MKKIIDFHTHPYLLQEENFCHYSDDFKLSPEEEKAELERAGITKICGSVISKNGYEPELGFERIKALNDCALEVKALYGDFYEPGFQIHPAYVKESLEVIEFMHKNGYRLIGEVVPYFHGWGKHELNYGSKELREILELAGEYEMVFSFHTMISWKDEMEKMIAQNPKVKFVAAHPNQKSDYLLHLERMEKYENAYLDISGSGLERYGMLREGIRRVGDDRLLFGTDFPITNPGMYVQAVLFEHISEESKEKILYRNAEKLLGLN